MENTQKEGWYPKELFSRFIPIRIEETLDGKLYLNNMNATA